MFYLVIVVFGFYATMMAIFIVGWRNALRSKGLTLETDDLITVLIPVRNEAANISDLIEDMFAQQDARFEVIVVDDHSEDETPSLVKAAINKYGSERLQLLSLVDVSGKKRAIDRGTQHANGSIIVTTDGDCRVPHNWIKSIRKQFDDDTIQLVFGGVRIVDNTELWSKLQAMEFTSLIGVSVATNAWGKPTMCNGANLAFRKEAFNAVGGYQDNYDVPSGDDEFLMRKIAVRYPSGIKFNPDIGSIVATQSQKTWKQFVNQRRRWAGKWKSHSSGMGSMLAFVVFAFHLLFIVSVAWMLFFGHYYLLPVFLGLKTIPELLFLRSVTKFLGGRWSWSAFLILQLVHSVYVITFALLAHRRVYEWKGRTLNSARYIVSGSYADNG